MSDIAGWVAAAATVIAAMMTAANLGSRITGYGFIVFVVGSLCWTTVGITSGQTSLVATNAFLTVVNLIGVWRWLGRQAKFDDGGNRAARRSAASRVPTLFSTAALAGSEVIDPEGQVVGTVVDAMAKCDGSGLAYVVICVGGIGGVGERLYTVDPKQLIFAQGQIKTSLKSADFDGLVEIEPDNWPASLKPSCPKQGHLDRGAAQGGRVAAGLIH